MAKIAIPRLVLAAGMLGNSGRTATTEAANANQRTHGHSAPAEIHGVETRTPKRTSSPFRRKAAGRAMTISPAASAVRASAKPRFVTPTVTARSSTRLSLTTWTLSPVSVFDAGLNLLVAGDLGDR